MSSYQPDSTFSNTPNERRDVAVPSEFMLSGMTRSQAYNLYMTHFLSTWNVRTYEFAAVIFTAAAYPDTLAAASIRGIVRTIASICFSPSVGRWVDQHPNRLRVLLATVSINRIAVISASALWSLILNYERIFNVTSPSELLGYPTPSAVKGILFGTILICGVFEGLSASGNMMSMERDWVVAAAAPNGKPFDLTHLNSSMRRIDLICKLIAPILISIVVSTTDVRIGVLAVAGMSILSWGIEVWCATRVWNLNPSLRAPKVVRDEEEEEEVAEITAPLAASSTRIWDRFIKGCKQYALEFRHYFTSDVWIPSLSLAFLHLSALSYSATFITYLLAAGFSLDLITVARAAGSIVEISSTVVTPIGVKYMGKAFSHGRHLREERTRGDSSTRALLEEETHEGRTETGLERCGLWGISSQLLNLIPVVFALWSLSPTPMPSSISPLISRLMVSLPSQPILAFLLFFFLSLSRLGLWIYDLTTQQITQTMTLPSQRSSFTGVEYSFASLFELGQYILTIILHRPEEFKWVALVSWAAVAVSTFAYASWVRKVRGHLVHWERIGEKCKCATARL